jgi:hypothetical protein
MSPRIVTLFPINVLFEALVVVAAGTGAAFGTSAAGIEIVGAAATGCGFGGSGFISGLGGSIFTGSGFTASTLGC